MDTKKFIAEHYDTAKKIYDICEELKLPISDARLLTYIYHKAVIGKNGIEYFYESQPVDIYALKVMTGRTKAVKGTLANRLANVERKVQSEHGIEQRFTPELKNRLRLYIDPEFRREKIELFEQKIMPHIQQCIDG